jgi:bacterial/archaeal transporter family-2 protein
MSPLISLLGRTLLAAAAGVSFIVQQEVNASLSAALRSSAWAGFVSYLGGTLCMLVLVITAHEAIPSAAVVARSNWWAWSGGFFGAVYIVIAILLVPRVGAATFTAALVAGQMISSVIFDHYGLFGVVHRPVDLLRIVGAVLLLGGVILIRH